MGSTSSGAGAGALFLPTIDARPPSASHGGRHSNGPSKGRVGAVRGHGAYAPGPSLPIPRYRSSARSIPRPRPLARNRQPVPSSLSILLPALNEEDGVEAVMKRITTTLQPKGSPIPSTYSTGSRPTRREPSR